MKKKLEKCRGIWRNFALNLEKFGENWRNFEEIELLFETNDPVSKKRKFKNENFFHF